MRIVVANTGDAPCVVSGYLGFQMRDVNLEPLNTTVTDGSTLFHPDPGVHPIVLDPGRHAAADLAVDFLNKGDPAGVQPLYIDVTVPGVNGPPAQIDFRKSNILPGLTTTALEVF